MALQLSDLISFATNCFPISRVLIIAREIMMLIKPEKYSLSRQKCPHHHYYWLRFVINATYWRAHALNDNV
jgi:hypothetical protein